jgi:hypothetical protein
MMEQGARFSGTKKAIGMVGALLALCGCASHPWEAEIDKSAYACSQYGFYPGSKEWDDCVKFVDVRRGKPFTP